MIKALVWDFDGTIADDFDLILNAENELSKQFRFRKLNKSELRNITLSKILKSEDLSFYNYLEIYYKLKKEATMKFHEIKLFSEVVKIIKSLQVKQYIITSNIAKNSTRLIEGILHENNISNIEEVIHSNYFLGKSKTLKKFLLKHKLKSSEIIYIGDETSDIKACNKQNVKIISVSWGYNSFNMLKEKNPNYLVSKPNELKFIINHIL